MSCWRPAEAGLRSPCKTPCLLWCCALGINKIQMYLLDPLQAYRCAVGNMYIQLALGMTMTCLIIREDFKLEDMRYSILYTLISHYLSFVFDFIRVT